MVPRDGRLELGVVDRRAHGHGPRAAGPGRDPADPLDAEPADPRAGDEGDPAALQGGSAEAVGRADEVLQGEQDQPVCLLPADRLPDPDLHLALLRPQGLREGDLPPIGRIARLARPREHHREGQRRLGAGAHRRLRREPAPLDVPDVDCDAEPVAADHDHGAAGRLPPLHPAVSVRLDDLLAHDEPVDDRAGHRHSTADAEAGGATQALEPYPQPRTSLRRSPSRQQLSDGNARPKGSSAPRRVKRKGGGRSRR